ncbi:uncharacterized protein AC631_00639 [Debaryomyces fabryi]|uniref:Uncharacterized protein n=1 Tax=Debaryomyces fabryi TaxID=58627 RepID=A0A0V1Q593_9ASCO|nr:uncharacterized protein AC631_00639 [Debaryomyces fabryi]KSA03664.1 hypothetical protein AC631_00639 [Debaryomyces fabryi]CUM52598.1 unnamed protein product [Debaryomyces fabryi]
MFSRRQNRSVHGTSYTGVNPAASGSNQPNNNALAAALSIGKSLKQQGAPGVHATSGTSNQYLSKPPQKRNSLLKRDSITRSPNSNRFRNFSDASYNSTNSHSMQTPPQSMQRRSSIQGHNFDDSFDDSYYDDINQNATQSYNNAKMRDLRLSHQLSPPPSRNGQVHQDNSTVKMVKKYIPTPNGIKIIEVPETVYQKEVARNNSMRSLPRSGSMTSLSQKRIPRSPSLSSVSGATRKTSHQRLSSFGRSPVLGTMAENEELQSRRRHNEDSELQRLQEQIDHEKQVSKDLELKRLEYEKVKLERLENEKKILLLKKEAANNKDIDVSEVIDEDDEEDVPLPNILVIVDEVENKRLEQNGELVTNKNVAIEKPSLGEINDISKDEDINAEDDTSIYEEEAIPEASIDASSVVVDELEKKNKEGDEAYDIGASEHLQNGFRNDQGAAELNVISQYSDSREILNRDSIIDNPIPVSTDEEDFGIEEVPYDKSEEGNLAKHLRPTFDSQPEVIDSRDSGPKFDPEPEIIGTNGTIQLGESNQDMVDVDDPRVEELAITTLQIPSSSLNNDSSSSSAKSAGSLDSNIQQKSEKRPVKSAMKNSSSFYNNSSNNSSTVKNAAQDAYLSLATAENTRLNSKLSSTQLNDAGPQFNNGTNQNQSQLNNQYQENQPNQTKRISTLRKSPSTQSPGLASRTLRPQSTLPETLPHSSQHQPPVNGMGNRQLRDRASAHINPTRNRASYVNQITPHPALQPNYQSPSKTKAAELYAKANARPTSSFAPTATKKNSDIAAKQQAQKARRTTLRDMSSTNQAQRVESPLNNTPQNANEDSSNTVENRRTFKSRLADSDEEDGHEGKSKFFGGGFSSRFNDSDEDLGGHSRNQHIASSTTARQSSKNNEHPASKTLPIRNNPPMEGKSDQVLKSKSKDKKKFAKLRKLFGKD